MYGTIEVPEPFYDYEKKDKAAVAARWASKTAERAAVKAEKKAAKQAAVQQAKAEAAAKAAKAAVKAATKRAAKKMEKNAAAAEQSEEKTEEAAGDKMTKQVWQCKFDTAMGTQCRIAWLSHTRKARARSPLERDLASMPPMWRSHAKPMCPPVAPGPRKAFRNCCLSGSETSVRFALQR